jgi:hypothetical protein
MYEGVKAFHVIVRQVLSSARSVPIVPQLVDALKM